MSSAMVVPSAPPMETIDERQLHADEAGTDDVAREVAALTRRVDVLAAEIDASQREQEVEESHEEDRIRNFAMDEMAAAPVELAWKFLITYVIINVFIYQILPPLVVLVLVVMLISWGWMMVRLGGAVFAAVAWQLWQWLIEFYNAVPVVVWNWFAGEWNGMLTDFLDVRLPLGWLNGPLNAVLPVAGRGVDMLTSAIRSGQMFVNRFIAKAANGVVDAMGGIQRVQAFANGIKSTFSSAINSVQSAVHDVEGAVGSVEGSVRDVVSRVETIWNKIKSLGGSIAGGISGWSPIPLPFSLGASAPAPVLASSSAETTGFIARTPAGADPSVSHRSSGDRMLIDPSGVRLPPNEAAQIVVQTISSALQRAMAAADETIERVQDLIRNAAQTLRGAVAASAARVAMYAQTLGARQQEALMARLRSALSAVTSDLSREIGAAVNTIQQAQSALRTVAPQLAGTDATGLLTVQSEMRAMDMLAERMRGQYDLMRQCVLQASMCTSPLAARIARPMTALTGAMASVFRTALAVAGGDDGAVRTALRVVLNNVTLPYLPGSYGAGFGALDGNATASAAPGGGGGFTVTVHGLPDDAMMAAMRSARYSRYVQRPLSTVAELLGVRSGADVCVRAGGNGTTGPCVFANATVASVVAQLDALDDASTFVLSGPSGGSIAMDIETPQVPAAARGLWDGLLLWSMVASTIVAAPATRAALADMAPPVTMDTGRSVAYEAVKLSWLPGDPVPRRTGGVLVLDPVPLIPPSEVVPLWALTRRTLPREWEELASISGANASELGMLDVAPGRWISLLTGVTPQGGMQIETIDSTALAVLACDDANRTDALLRQGVLRQLWIGTNDSVVTAGEVVRIADAAHATAQGLGCTWAGVRDWWDPAFVQHLAEGGQHPGLQALSWLPGVPPTSHNFTLHLLTVARELTSERSADGAEEARQVRLARANATAAVAARRLLSDTFPEDGTWPPWLISTTNFATTWHVNLPAYLYFNTTFSFLTALYITPDMLLNHTTPERPAWMRTWSQCECGHLQSATQQLMFVARALVGPHTCKVVKALGNYTLGVNAVYAAMGWSLMRNRTGTSSCEDLEEAVVAGLRQQASAFTLGLLDKSEFNETPPPPLSRAEVFNCSLDPVTPADKSCLAINGGSATFTLAGYFIPFIFGMLLLVLALSILHTILTFVLIFIRSPLTILLSEVDESMAAAAGLSDQAMGSGLAAHLRFTLISWGRALGIGACMRTSSKTSLQRMAIHNAALLAAVRRNSRYFVWQ